MATLQGVDIKKSIALTSDANPVAISSLIDYEVYLYASNQGRKDLKIVFKKTPTLPTDRDIIIVDDSQGLIDIVIPRTYTSIAPPLEHFIEVKVKESQDSSFINSNSVTNGVADGNNYISIGCFEISANPKALR